MEAATPAWAWLARWAHFLGTLILVGAVVVRWAVAPRALAPDARSVAYRRLGAAGLFAAGLVGASLVALFAAQLVEFRDPFVPWTEDATVLLRTDWGHGWAFAVLLAAVSAAVFGVLARAQVATRAIGWGVAAVLAGALAFAPGAAGHAALGPLPWTRIADGLHVLAAGAWLGSLPLLLVLAFSASDPRDGARWFEAFSPIALASGGVLVVTGVGAAWVHLPDLSALTSSDYGRLLLAKTALVAVAMAMGALNWRRGVPRMRDGDPRFLRRAAAVECLVALAVLAVTAWLVHTSPPGS